MLTYNSLLPTLSRLLLIYSAHLRWATTTMITHVNRHISILYEFEGLEVEGITGTHRKFIYCIPNNFISLLSFSLLGVCFPLEKLFLFDLLCLRSASFRAFNPHSLVRRVLKHRNKRSLVSIGKRRNSDRQHKGL